MKSKWNLKLLTLCITGMLLSVSACGKGNETAEDITLTPKATTAPTEEVTPEPTKEVTPEPTKEVTPEPTPIPETYLKDLFAEHGMKLGTCFTTQMANKRLFADIVRNQFNSITMENSMKPDYLFDQAASKTAGDLVVSFNSDMLQMMEWAKENGFMMRGHTLVWYSQTPNWIFRENFDASAPLVTREVMLARMESYIRQVFEKLEEGGYTDLIYAYDVVNEAWMEDGSIRSAMNPWQQIIGDDYLWYAFYFADKYAPESIELYYNDYNEQYKTETILSFVETLKDENGRYLIDGIGCQAHLYTEDDLEQYLSTIEAFGATGLKVELTELDICLGAYQKKKPATETYLRQQGQYYYNLINALFELKDSGKVNMDALTIWGFADGLSWRKEYSPLIYDTLYQKKFAYYGMMQMKELAGFEE